MDNERHPIPDFLCEQSEEYHVHLPFSMFKLNRRLSFNEDFDATLCLSLSLKHNSSNLLFNFYHYHQFDCRLSSCMHSSHSEQLQKFHDVSVSTEINSEINYIAMACVGMSLCVFKCDKLHNLYTYLCASNSCCLSSAYLSSVNAQQQVDNGARLTLPIVKHLILLPKINADLTRHIVNMINIFGGFT